ncbi:unnamed protein product [Cuscuta epithymum]|nr:unnamed protein product [Cuscuta epithymum]
MEKLLVTLLFDGRWNAENRFVAKSSSGLLVEENASFPSLLHGIRTVLGISQNVEITCLSYQIDKAFPPTIIGCEESLQFYMCLKKREINDVSSYPMCVQSRKSRDLSDLQKVGRGEGVGVNNNESFDLNVAGLDIQRGTSTEVVDMCNSEHLVHGTSDHRNAFQVMESRNLSIIDACNYDAIGEGQTPLISWIQDGGNRNIDGMDTTLRINGMYPSKEYLKETLQLYAIHNKFQFKTKTSHPGVIHYVCVGERCKWAVRGVRISDTDCFEVKRFDSVHSCSIDSRLGGNKQATAAIVGKLIKHQYMDASRKPYPPKAIIADLNRELGLHVNYKKAWRAKEKALTSLTGTDFES